MSSRLHGFGQSTQDSHVILNSHCWLCGSTRQTSHSMLLNTVHRANYSCSMLLTCRHFNCCMYEIIFSQIITMINPAICVLLSIFSNYIRVGFFFFSKARNHVHKLKSMHFVHDQHESLHLVRKLQSCSAAQSV